MILLLKLNANEAIPVRETKLIGVIAKDLIRDKMNKKKHKMIHY